MARNCGKKGYREIMQIALGTNTMDVDDTGGGKLAAPGVGELLAAASRCAGGGAEGGGGLPDGEGEGDGEPVAPGGGLGEATGCGLSRDSGMGLQ
jgi:hypothetical protein